MVHDRTSVTTSRESVDRAIRIWKDHATERRRFNTDMKDKTIPHGWSNKLHLGSIDIVVVLVVGRQINLINKPFVIPRMNTMNFCDIITETIFQKVVLFIFNLVVYLTLKPHIFENGRTIFHWLWISDFNEMQLVYFSFSFSTLLVKYKEYNLSGGYMTITNYFIHDILALWLVNISYVEQVVL